MIGNTKTKLEELRELVDKALDYHLNLGVELDDYQKMDLNDSKMLMWNIVEEMKNAV